MAADGKSNCYEGKADRAPALDEGKSGWSSNPKKASSKDLIECVNDFFYHDDEFTDRVSVWAKERCRSFENFNPDDGSGHPLSHTSLHREYCDLFEGMLEKHVRDSGYSFSEFSDALIAEEAAFKAKKTYASFAGVAHSYTSFDAFCEMMTDVANGEEPIFCPPLISSDAANAVSEDLNWDQADLNA